MTKEKVYFMGLLANVDSSILDMEFEHDFEIKQMEHDKIVELLVQLESLPDRKIMCDLHMEYMCVMNDTVFFIHKELEYEIKDDVKRDRIIALTELVNDVASYPIPTIRLMRLYKQGNICLVKKYFYTILNDASGPSITEGPIPHIESEKYILQKTEVPILKRFINDTKIPFKLNYLDLAFENFELSYQINNRNLKFLTLMIGMEALFNQGGSEITYKISRGLATLIGEDKDNTEHIFKRMYKSKMDGQKGLYNLRSKIVHDGEPNVVKEEDVLELRDYLRRAIKEVNIINEEKKELADMLNSSGFDEKPWRKKR